MSRHCHESTPPSPPKPPINQLKVLSLHRDDFHKLLGRLDTLRHMWRFEALRRVPLLRGLPDKARAELAAALSQLTVPRGAAVVTQAGLLRGSAVGV